MASLRQVECETGPPTRPDPILPVQRPEPTPRTAAPGALRADYARYLAIARADHAGLRAHLAALSEFGFLAIAVFRFGRWTRRIRPRLLSLPFKLAYRVADFFVQVLFGISLSSNSEIGPGFYIGHFGGIVVHGRLGANCSIGQGVTIGAKGGGRSNGYPDIGDGVYLGAGSMVIGRIRVGHGALVGANTVVVQDVPDGCRVVSAPARILPPREQG